MHEIDRALMEKIQEFFGGIGYISKPNNNLAVEFRVSTLNDIANVIIPHFYKYPLVTPWSLTGAKAKNREEIHRLYFI